MRRLTLAVTLVLLAAGSVTAHHGYANFDRDKLVTIDGVLEELMYGNPHVVMKIRHGSDLYVASWDSANVVWRRAHFNATTFHVGDRIIVTGCPSRDATAHELALLTEVARPADGWRWKSPRTATN